MSEWDIKVCDTVGVCVLLDAHCFSDQFIQQLDVQLASLTDCSICTSGISLLCCMCHVRVDLKVVLNTDAGSACSFHHSPLPPNSYLSPIFSQWCTWEPKLPQVLITHWHRYSIKSHWLPMLSIRASEKGVGGRTEFCFCVLWTHREGFGRACTSSPIANGLLWGHSAGGGAKSLGRGSKKRRISMSK